MQLLNTIEMDLYHNHFQSNPILLLPKIYLYKSKHFSIECLHQKYNNLPIPFVNQMIDPLLYHTIQENPLVCLYSYNRHHRNVCRDTEYLSFPDY